MPLAHAGHWLAELVYVVPVLAVVVAIAWRSIQERRHPDLRAQREAEDQHEPPLDNVLDGKE
jgi:ABC-type siderophore export system fused ATPase/permease subunit